MEGRQEVESIKCCVPIQVGEIFEGLEILAVSVFLKKFHH